MPTDGEVLDLVGEIYDCAVEPARWPSTLERLCGHVGAALGAITLQDVRSRSVRMVASWGVDPAFERVMQEKFTLNPLVSHAWFVDVDEPFSSIRVLGEEEHRHTRFYQEVVGPYGYYDAALAVLAKSAVRFGSISLPRRLSDSVYTDAELAALGVLTPHIRRSVIIADLLDARSLQQDMLSATLDLLTVAIVLVDREGRIVHANHAGLAYLDERGALRRDGDCLSARDPKAASDLKDAIVKVASGAIVDFPKSGIAVPIASADGHDLAAWVLPLDRGLRNQLAAPFAAYAAVFVRPLGGDAAPFPGELFVKRYGISPAECRVLMMLTHGMTPREAAEALGISEPTAKTHLQRLFQKTGTDRQADLMRLTMSALAPATLPS